MKKYIFMAVAGMLALSSCSSDDNKQNSQKVPQKMTFTAGFGNDNITRTTINEDRSVLFDYGDAFSLFSTNNFNKKFTTEDEGAEATFTGEAVAGDNTYYAVYPYSDVYSFSDEGDVIVSGVEIQTSQNVLSFVFDEDLKNSYISYAETQGSNLRFHNACALLKIYNDTETDLDIDISVNEPSLTGTFDLNLSTGKLTATDGSTDVVSVIGEYETIYLAIAPGEYTNFTAQADDDGYYSKMKASVKFEAGKIYDLGNITDWGD